MREAALCTLVKPLGRRAAVAFEGSPPPATPAEAEFADTLVSAAQNGLSLEAVKAAASAAYAAYDFVSKTTSARVSEAIAHNAAEGPEGPQILLPLCTLLLTYLVNRLHCDA